MAGTQPSDRAVRRAAEPVCRVPLLILTLAVFGQALLGALPQDVPEPKKSPTHASDVLFDPSVVHDIHLSMKPEDWATLLERFEENTYYPADLHWQDETAAMVGVRSRGSGSRNGSKPALRIDINRYVGQKFLKLEALVLANAIQDPSMLRQRLAMLVFARMGIVAPRVVHARLYVNGEYIGLYELMEEIAKPFLTRVFGRKENGGHLFEYRWKDGYLWDYLGPDLDIYADLFEPKTHESDSPAELYGPLEEMFRHINEADDGLFERAVSEYLDLRSFVRYLAVESFISDIDGFLGDWGPNNFYLYRFEDGYVSALIPWDKDSAFQDIRADLFRGVDDNVLARRALAIPWLRRAYVEEMLACAEEAMTPVEPESPTGWFEAEVYRESDQIRDAAYADGRKWYTDARFEDEVQKMKHFAATRPVFVAEEARKVLERLLQEAR